MEKGKLKLKNAIYFVITIFKIWKLRAFSAVYSGFWRGTPVAIKKININSVQYTFSSSDFQKEILILRF